MITNFGVLAALAGTSSIGPEFWQETTHDIRNSRHHRRRHYGLRHRDHIAQHGINVRMVDISEEAVERAIETVGGFYDRNAEKGRMSAEDTARPKQLSGGTDIGLAGSADLVIEAVFERFDLKEELLVVSTRSSTTRPSWRQTQAA